MGTLNKEGLLALAGAMLLVGTGPAASQIARPATSQTMQPASPQTAQPTAPASGAVAPQQMLYYVCGGAGVDGRATSPDPAHPFNLGVSFISASNGAPLSEVSVKLRRHGRVLMDFIAAGPHCLFSVPEADYRIEGTYRGEMKFEIVQTGNMNAQIKW
ncbi:hypothetical protein P3T23_000080 [Paraburkholderia sp. GAS448]|jgi:hypothetical protein|uniref:hypothetical protein n=1 Tax=Paraburkholderia sp. GAS448 TaxID=3035136 RepID=UPI003D1EBE19